MLIGILSEWHKTLVLGSLQIRTKLDMKSINVLAHNLDLVLLDKCSEMVISCLELEIFNKKVEVLFLRMTKIECNLNFPL